MFEIDYANLKSAPQKPSTKADPAADYLREIAQKRWDYFIMIRRVFTTKDGKALLGMLREQTIEQDVISLSMAIQHGADVSDRHAWMRQGQNALVKDLERGVEIAGRAKNLDQFIEMYSANTTNNL